MKRKMRLAALLCAAAMITASGTASYAYDDESAEDDISIVEIPSENGYDDIIYVDENGSEVFFDLLPDAEMYICTLPYYNLYDEGRMTSVKNQGKDGLCWAFAGMAAVESNLITQRLESINIDLSEKYMAWFTNGTGPIDTNDPLYGDVKNELGIKAYNKGGNLYDVTYLMARGSGPVYESLVPQSTDSPLPETMRYTSLYGLESMQMFDKNDISSIKTAVFENGGAFLSFYSSNSYLNTSNYAYYCPNSTSPNHAVTIVGWDDSFSSTNFKTGANLSQPPADGAWIIKNSWGANWGNSGLFYISYYDKSMKTVGSIKMAADKEYDRIYQYDGNVKTFTRYPSNYISGGNIFTAASDETINGVGFWTSDADVPYRIRIYKNIPEGGTPTDGELIYEQSGYEPYAGYHSVKFDQLPNIESGCRFSAVVDLLRIGTGITFDSYGYAQETSFYSAYKNGTYSWKDSVASRSQNVCIKVLASEKEHIMTIGECIDYVNSFDPNDTILSDKQFEAVKRVLEYDYGRQ